MKTIKMERKMKKEFIRETYSTFVASICSVSVLLLFHHVWYFIIDDCANPDDEKHTSEIESSF